MWCIFSAARCTNYLLCDQTIENIIIFSSAFWGKLRGLLNLPHSLLCIMPMTPVRHNILVSFYREWENVNFKCVYFYMINNSLVDRCKFIMNAFKTFSFTSSPPVPSEYWHVMTCKVSDWRNGNDTRVRRVLLDMSNAVTFRVVIWVGEWNDTLRL